MGSHQQAAKIEQGLQTLGIRYSEHQLSQLVSFLELLQKWNHSFNLVADSSEDELIYRHLLDSVTINPHLRGSVVLDIGSGAGFPGVPLAILNPEMDFILVDSNGKKTRFLFQVKLALGLENLTVENCRIEHYQSHRQIDIVTCRAFSTLHDTVVLAESVLAEGSRLLAMKGRFPEAEIDTLPPTFKVSQTVKLEVPGSDADRHLIEVCGSRGTN